MRAMNILRESFTPRFSPRTKRITTAAALPLLAAAAFLAALWLGSTDASLPNALHALLAGDFENIDCKIIFYVRLPRALGALLAGAALAVSGVIIQAVLGNPMAAPNVIGVNAGAGFFAIISMAVLPKMIGYLPFAAFIGALFAALLIYAVSAATGADRVTVTLVGVAVGSILTAGINTVKTLFPDSVYDVSGFLIGGLSAVDLGDVLPAAWLIVPALALALVLARGLDVLSLGEEVAASLGVTVKRARLLWLVLASALAGAAVSYSGLIGFVGLIVPHLLRRLVGNSHKSLIFSSAFGGGAFLLVCDTAARTLFAPYELPVGILLSLVGGPFFIFLVLGERRARR